MAGISTSVVEVENPSVIGAVAGLASRQARALGWDLVGGRRQLGPGVTASLHSTPSTSLLVVDDLRRFLSLGVSSGSHIDCFPSSPSAHFQQQNTPPSERPPNMSQHALSDQQVRNLTTKPHIITSPSIGHALLTCIRSPVSRSTMSSAR